VRRRLAGDEQGSTTTEVVLLVPVLLFLVMLVVEFGLWFHAQHVAQAAADEGARAAKVEGRTSADGAARANGFLDQAASDLLEDRTVDANRTTELSSVTVRGHVVGVVPGLHLAVRAQATDPVERFRPDGGAP
jgi:Flp pilus assembly protein TadG